MLKVPWSTAGDSEFHSFIHSSQFMAHDELTSVQVRLKPLREPEEGERLMSVTKFPSPAGAPFPFIRHMTAAFAAISFPWTLMFWGLPVSPPTSIPITPCSMGIGRHSESKTSAWNPCRHSNLNHSALTNSRRLPCTELREREIVISDPLLIVLIFFKMALLSFSHDLVALFAKEIFLQRDWL